MTPRTPPPRPALLLVEDDPASRAFLATAVVALPARVVAATSCREAMDAVADGPGFALWLVDAQLGDGDGASLLAHLRARHPETPAVAHTATRDPAIHAALVAAGFDAVVPKPLPAALLRETVRGLLGDACGDWDDRAALAALAGNPAHVEGLRALFLAELPAQGAAVSEALARGDRAAADAVLHRLRASCGFVGASRLGDAVRVLDAAPDDAGALARFAAAIRSLLS